MVQSPGSRVQGLKGLILLAGLIAGMAAVSAALESGKWAVGFRVVSESDLNRPLGDGSPRPLQISVWYPASRGRGRPMTYRDYVALTAAEPHAEKKPLKAEEEKAVEEFRSFLLSAKVTPDDVSRVLAAPMTAFRDTPATKGRFPLVLISQGNGQSAHDQAFLAETIASHGYAVATTPSASRISGPMKSEEDIAAKAEEQAGDLARAAFQVKTRAELEGEGLAVIGHSFGARAALLLAMSNSSARALVSLDGGIGAKTGKGMLERSGLFHAKAMTAPVLHFYEDLDPFMAPDFALLDSLEGSRRFFVRVPAMHHVHFTSAGSLASLAPSLASATGATAATAESVETVARSTVSFLDSVLKTSPGGPKGWKPPGEKLSAVERPPGAGKAEWIAGPQGRLRIDDGGAGGPSLLFVHGNGGNRTQWNAQLEHFRKTRRAAAFDLRGMGESERAANADYSVEGFASDVAAVADALKLERFVLVGHSFGGAVVASYAGKHPDRLAGLVFADVAGDLRGTPADQVERLRRNLEPATYEEFTRRWFEAILAKGSEATKAAVMTSLRATPREVFVAASLGLYSFDPAAALTPYRGPRIHIASYLTESPQAIHRSVPEVRLRPIAEASHWLMMDRPDEFNRILEEFLDSLR